MKVTEFTSLMNRRLLNNMPFASWESADRCGDPTWLCQCHFMTPLPEIYIAATPDMPRRGPFSQETGNGTGVAKPYRQERIFCSMRTGHFSLKPRFSRRSSAALVGLLISGLLSGCAAVGLTLFGVGAGVTTGTAVSYTLDGVAYRTFTAPLPRVRSATLTALNNMGIQVNDKLKTEQGETIKAAGTDREIEIELEAVTPKTTRIRTVAKQGWFFKDRATATEIILQTEKVLNGA